MEENNFCLMKPKQKLNDVIKTSEGNEFALKKDFMEVM
jgi:hypothetical protein